MQCASLTLHPPTASVAAPPGTPIDLTAYALLYTIEQARLPLSAEYEAVEELTAAYVNEHFQNSLASGLVQFQRADTEMTQNQFNFREPVVVNYTTALTFAENSTIPAINDLNMVLSAAFEGENNALYLARLANLPMSNIFQTTSVVTFEFTPETNTRSSESVAVIAGVSVGASAGVGALLISLAVFYRRRRKNKENGKPENEEVKGDGHVSLSSETSCGDSLS